MGQVSERAEAGPEKKDVLKQYRYPSMTKTQSRDGSSFILHVKEGEFTDSEIIVLLGENGTGKTTFVRMVRLSRVCLSGVKRLRYFFGMSETSSSPPSLRVSPHNFHPYTMLICSLLDY